MKMGDNIKVGVKEVGGGDGIIDWFDVTQDCVYNLAVCYWGCVTCGGFLE